MTATIAIEAAGAVIGSRPLPLCGAGAPMIDAWPGRRELDVEVEGHAAADGELL